MPRSDELVVTSEPDKFLDTDLEKFLKVVVPVDGMSADIKYNVRLAEPYHSSSGLKAVDSFHSFSVYKSVLE